MQSSLGAIKHVQLSQNIVYIEYQLLTINNKDGKTGVRLPAPPPFMGVTMEFDFRVIGRFETDCLAKCH
jgi:hypothetical protein